MISAIILAAGESRRMGRPKMLMPWGEDTVLGHVISVFEAAGIDDMVVVTGGARSQVETSLQGKPRVRCVFNPEFANGEMLGSIKCGLAAQRPAARATLIGLGDQPQVQEETVRRVCEAFAVQGARLVVPSYAMRRGHPWLIVRELWSELMALPAQHSARDFLNARAAEIVYVKSESASVIEDIDTPEDYGKYQSSKS